MAENNIEEVKTAGEKNGIRKGYIFLSFIPFAILMAVQTAATTPGIILAMLDMQKQDLPMEMTTMMDIFNKKYAVFCDVGYCLVCIAIYIPWYYKGIVKKSLKVSYKKALGIKPVILSVSILICMYFLISGAAGPYPNFIKSWISGSISRSGSRSR